LHLGNIGEITIRLASVDMSHRKFL